MGYNGRHWTFAGCGIIVSSSHCTYMTMYFVHEALFMYALASLSLHSDWRQLSCRGHKWWPHPV